MKNNYTNIKSNIHSKPYISFDLTLSKCMQTMLKLSFLCETNSNPVNSLCETRYNFIHRWLKQVFFRAGVLGQMEEFRDERLSRIMSWMQSWARGYLTRKTFKKLQEQRMALTVVQRSLRRYLKLRTWPWWKLWQKVKPLLNASRVEDQIAVSIDKKIFTSFIGFLVQ